MMLRSDIVCPDRILDRSKMVHVQSALNGGCVRFFPQAEVRKLEEAIQ